MLIVGCNPEVEETFTPLTLVPTAVSAELPEEVKMARDAALAYVNFQLRHLGFASPMPTGQSNVSHQRILSAPALTG